MRILFFIATILLLIIPIKSLANGNLESLLKDFILENYPWADVEINNLKVDKEIPEEGLEKINILKPPPGRSKFVFQFKNSKNVEVSANIRAFEQVVMSRKQLPKGYIVQEKDIYVTLLDTFKLPQGYISDRELVIGKRLTRSILANRPIVESMINDSVIVKKGQRVLVVAQSPNLRITTIGETLENASIGSNVKVMNIATRKVLRGILIEEGLVSVEF
jgi:flagella basal body P-ring formation protein FlgA